MQIKLANDKTITLVETQTKARNGQSTKFNTFLVNDWKDLLALSEYLDDKGRDSLADDVGTYVVNKYFRALHEANYAPERVACVHEWNLPAGQGRKADPEKKIAKMMEGLDADSQKALLAKMLEALG